MRKIILNLAVTLDGFIEGEKGEYDWCFTDQDYGMTDFLNRIDAIFFGRKSYELLIGTENNPYPDKKKYVFSNTLSALPYPAVLVKGNLEEEVMKIKKQDGKDIWLFGGAELTKVFLEKKWVDELLLSIHPLLLAKGKLLFHGLNEKIELHLLHTAAYPSGLVQVHYEVKK